MRQRQTNPFDPNLDSGFLRFLYRPVLGAPLRFLMTRKWVSQLGGAYMDAGISKYRIAKFVKSNHIDLSDYEDRPYSSFNDFFTRKILPYKRVFSSDPADFCSPADSRLSAFKVEENAVFTIKSNPFTLEELLCDKALAKEYAKGMVLVFRLSVDDYHRYAFFDGGKVASAPRYVPGAFHTVRPIAFAHQRRVLCQNAREVTVLQTENFGKAIQIEVGAMMVGRIVNHPKEEFLRAEEKGYFAFGGSTVVLILKEGAVELDPVFFENTANGLETRVLCGETIGKKLQ